MEPFALFQFLRSLLPPQTEQTAFSNVAPARETENSSADGGEKQESASSLKEQGEQPTPIQTNAFLDFIEAHEARAKRLKK